MAHELDNGWTLYVAFDDGSTNYDPIVNGSLYLKIGAGGAVDRSLSRHDPGNGTTPTEIDGTVTTIATGYRVNLSEHFMVGPNKLKRPFKGGLIARINGQLVMAGVVLKDQPELIPKRKKGGKKAAAAGGQEDGVWVATKP